MSGTIHEQAAGAVEPADQALQRAQAATQARRFGEASGICDDVLARHPQHPFALALLGIIAGLKGDPERAVELLGNAVRQRPGVASWHANYASVCRMTNRTEEALAHGHEAVRLEADSPDHLVNLSLILVDADDRERATACLLRAIGLKHDHADAHLALAQALLARGEFEPGWLEYEWRNQTEAGRVTLPRLTSAPWNGMRIPQGRLLLVGDQGYGDTIQFARYIPMVADRCQEVVLGCSEELGPLVRGIPGITQICHRWNDIPGHAAYCRLSSLPGLVGTTLDTIPGQVPYLRAEPDRIAFWAARLAEQSPKGARRIGLAWTGRPTHPNDRRRSLRLQQLAPLARAGDIAFVSIQKPLPAADLPWIAHFPGMLDLADQLTNFGETAAVIENLDLVITIDTAVGHLAGALGKPVWVMLPRAADWRWLLDRSDSPWYPTARLFRQHRPGAWDDVVADVAGALASQVELALTQAS